MDVLTASYDKFPIFSTINCGFQIYTHYFLTLFYPSMFRFIFECNMSFFS